MSYLETSTKCVALRFTNKSPPESSPYSVENTNLDFTLSHKDLGIFVSYNLTLSNHFKVVCSKAYSALSLIKRTISHHSAVLPKNSYTYLLFVLNILTALKFGDPILFNMCLLLLLLLLLLLFCHLITDPMYLSRFNSYTVVINCYFQLVSPDCRI